MSLYNQLFGFDPLAPLLLKALAIDPLYVPRFRDCFLLEGKVAVYTRTGGDNRHYNLVPWIIGGEYVQRTIAPDSWFALCAAHPDYLGNEDDEFDSTYAFWWFKYPESPEIHDALTALAEDGERPRPSARWQQLYQDMGKQRKDNDDNPYT